MYQGFVLRFLKNKEDIRRDIIPIIHMLLSNPFNAYAIYMYPIKHIIMNNTLCLLLENFSFFIAKIKAADKENIYGTNIKKHDNSIIILNCSFTFEELLSKNAIDIKILPNIIPK